MNSQQIPKHVINNFEETESAIYDLIGMLYALDLCMDHADSTNGNASAKSSVQAVLRQCQEIMAKIEKCHSAEWAGFGGATNLLNEYELAIARGEAEKLDPRLK